MWGISVLQSNVVSDAPVDGGAVRFDTGRPRISPIPSSEGQHDDTIPKKSPEGPTCALSTTENCKSDSEEPGSLPSVKPSYGAVRGSAHHITFLRRIARSAACATAYFRRGFRDTRCRPRGSASFFYHGVTLKPRVVTGYHRQDLSCLSTSHVQVTIQAVSYQCAFLVLRNTRG